MLPMLLSEPLAAPITRRPVQILEAETSGREYTARGRARTIPPLAQTTTASGTKPPDAPRGTEPGAVIGSADLAHSSPVYQSAPRHTTLEANAATLARGERT